jgi:hypothetical protein
LTKNFDEKIEIEAAKQDLADFRSELLKTIYLGSLGQLFAMICSVVAIVNLLK